MGGTPLISNSSAYADSNSWDFQYTGNVQSFTVPYTGTYKLDTWGAQGGNDTLNLSFTYHQGGLGGYAEGEVSLTKGETISVVVGGQGANTPSITNGGYNGGGGNDRSGSAGGGATHIATADGLLASLSNDKSAVLIVAGGGGGVDYGGKFDMEDGGYAGGPSYGNNKTATQTNGYSFGRGESVPFIDSGAGGGGWYGGYHGESKNLYSYGGGGSSYIGGVSDGKTIAGNQSMPSPSGETKTGKTGNGYARITFIKLDDTTSPVTTDNAPKDWVNKDVTVDLTATDNDGGSGIASTYYQLDNGSTHSGNEIKISAEGVHTLTYWSVDNAGNEETQHTTTVKIDKTVPVTTDNAPKDWVNKDVTVDLTATDNDGGSGIASTYYQLDNGSTHSGNEIKISAEGVHTLTYWSVDNAGNTEQFNTKTIKLDKTAPVLNISLDKTTIWPPNHKMVPITATINASDDTSGINLVVLTSITSNETLQSDDIQNANYNKPISGSTDSFELRADRLGRGNGRIYTVTYTAKDNTGNVTTHTATVTVPHDQSK
ncbi:glycine rich domain-containing protein [Peribacillus simplex]|uniref:glycine rich domain-containing protein n=1 Tax=Peribacillus simplex TaxID=1478 RepID=UPI0025A2C1D5|nr:glycine rich domain-containing protein [Peribacillus simplex]MDM5291737.1 glycine rich domain-containing protein [Peribacillus simplex]